MALYNKALHRTRYARAVNAAFRNMPARVNDRANIFVMIDEAHRTTGGDLGNFLMAGLPNATYIGFTGTPIDKTVYGKGTFKTFGCEDDNGYLHKYSIAESIKDGATLKLFYNLAPNAMRASAELMEQEFWSLAETEGVADIAELNRILERAVNLKNFLKGEERVDRIAQYVAEHYRENVEPLGYKAFLVAVDRDACAKYKKALDRYLPPDYSAVVYSGAHNDSEALKKHHIDAKREKQIRKDFIAFGKQPKLLIVTEKLLTGFDAPILYAIYLDKPMRDHTLLQAIARVNRPYENQAEGLMVKPHGLVLDFVGIFDNLEKALAFDSDEVNAIVHNVQELKALFKSKMEREAPPYLRLVAQGFNDRDIDGLIDHFRDKARRKAFFNQYKSIEMLYEVISPDAFLRPFIDDYATLSAIYQEVRKAYAKPLHVELAFQKKTNQLVQSHVGTSHIQPVAQFFEINEATVTYISGRKGGEGTKIINLVKSIEKIAEECSDDPFLIALADRARAVQEDYEDRQSSAQQALEALLAAIEKDEKRKKEQAEKGFDSLMFFVYRTLRDAGVTAGVTNRADAVCEQVRAAFAAHPNWRASEAERRDLRNQVTFALYDEMGDQATQITGPLFALLAKTYTTK